jgi:hypothetical protein
LSQILLDTNSLLLWVAGNCDREKIGNHRRLSSFSPEQFDWMLEVVANFSSHATLPNIVTEASNLIIQDSGSIFRNGAEFLAAYATEAVEHYIPTRKTVETGKFLRHGSTDIAILLYSMSCSVTVITGDHALYGMLMESKLQCYNIWHVLTP